MNREDLDQENVDREMLEAASTIIEGNAGIDLDGWDEWDLLILSAAIVNELGRRCEERAQCRH